MATKRNPERSKVNVFVRCRPHLQHDVSQYSTLTFPSKQEVLVKDESQPISYKFDHVFPADVSINEMFQEAVDPLICSFLSGVSSSLMAYGQICTGKTYNMLSANVGLVYQGIDRIFASIEKCSKYNYRVLFSFLQIYQDRIYDLLSQHDRSTSLHLREHPKEGVIIEGLSEVHINNCTDAEKLLAMGKERCVVSENTKTLQFQSRSHVICILKLEKYKKQNDTEISLEKIKTKKIRSKLFMCDLAGSERLNKSGVSRRHIEEARYINTSLLELGNVIHALTSRSSLYIPFRNSTLTRILKESLGGNSKASLMVCVSPALKDLMETKYSLNFGQRAMKIIKQASTNVEPRTDSHWLNYPLFQRRKNKKIDYRKLAEYLTSKLKDLEVAYNKEKENLRSLKRKLSKKRSDFMRNISTDSGAGESGGDSNQSTPSKTTGNRKLTILVEESTSTELGLANPVLDSTTPKETLSFLAGTNYAAVQTHTSDLSNQGKHISTQTFQCESKSCHTSTTSIFEQQQQQQQQRKFEHKSFNTSVQSLHREMITRTTSMTSLMINQSKGVMVDCSVNTSLKSIEACEGEDNKERFVDRSIDKLCSNKNETEVNENETRVLDKSTSVSSLNFKNTIEESRNILMSDKSTSFECLEDSATQHSMSPRENKVIGLKLDLPPPQKQTILVKPPIDVHEFCDQNSSINQIEAFDHVDGNKPIGSELLLAIDTSDLSLVNYRCTDADSDISLREAKILQSPKDVHITDHINPFWDSKSEPVSHLVGFPFPSFESEAEHIYREDTRYARKSLVKARNRYSALLQQLELLTSNEFFFQDGSKSSGDGECHDVVMKFKSELEEKLQRARESVSSSEETCRLSYAFGTAAVCGDSTTIDCVEGIVSGIDEKEDQNKLQKEMSSSSEFSDQTPSGVFGEEFVHKSREAENNNNESEVSFPSGVTESMEGKISPDVLPKVVKDVLTKTEENFSKKQDDKFKKQQKLTIAAIENAEIKKELLLTKLEKLRLEAVLSCVLIDTETNDMTKEFQQLSTRSMKMLTSSKSTLASATSCAHLPSISSPGSTFKNLQSPIKRFNYRERFVGGDHFINDVKFAEKVSLPDEVNQGVTKSVQTEKNVVDWLNGDHVRKLALEESSCLGSSDFDVSSISDLSSPLLLTEQRLSPCGQDYSPSELMYETDFDEVDKLLMQYKKKKPSSPASFALSCFPFLRNNKKHRLRNTLQNRPSTTLEMSDFPDC